MAINNKDTHSLQSNVRIAKNSFYMSIRMIIVLCITLYSTRIVLNTLGVEDYGVYNVVAGFVSLFSFLGTSLSNSIQRFYNYELAQKGVPGAKLVYNTSCLIQLALAIILVIILEVLGPWYIHNKMVLPSSQLETALSLFHCSVLSFVCIILQAPFLAAVMAHERMGYYSIVSVLDASLQLIIAFIIPYLGGDHLLQYGFLLLVIRIVVLVLYCVYARTMFEEIRLSANYDKKLLKSMLSFSGWNVFGTFSGVMKEQGVNLVMNLFFGPIINAAKGVATQVNNGIQSFVSNVIVPVRPQLVQSYSLGNIGRVMHLTYTVSKLSTYLLYIIALPLFYEIDYVLKLWLGANIPEYSGAFIRIVIITSFLNNLNASISGVVHASGIMKKYQLLGAITNLLAIPLVYIALSLGGSPLLAMIIVTAVTLLNQVVCMLVLKSIVHYSIKEYASCVILPFVYVVCLTAWIPYMLNCFMNPCFIRLSINVVLSTISIIAAAYLIGVTKEERGYINKIFSKIKR